MEKDSTSTPLFLSIEGNIGSGKSTLLEYLKTLDEFKNTLFVKEPVNEWRNMIGNTDTEKNINILDAYYKDSKRWSYSFQTFAFITRYLELERITNNNGNSNIIISERSHLSDREIFAKTLYQKGDMCDLEYKMYLHWFNILSEKHKYKKIIYVRTNPITSYNRIKKRSRMEEMNVPYEFIEFLHLKHEEWLNNTTIDVLILDGNIDIDDTNNILHHHKEAILKFLKSYR